MHVNLKRFLAVLMAALSALAASALAGEWRTIPATFVEDHRNDGDSFVLDIDGAPKLVRLYCVDCPEDSASAYKWNRVIDQADEFCVPAKSAETIVTDLGKQAGAFVADLLMNATNVLVTTRGQTCFGKRLYVFVEADGVDLGTLLVENGLARVHGVPVAGYHDYVGGSNTLHGRSGAEYGTGDRSWTY